MSGLLRAEEALRLGRVQVIAFPHPFSTERRFHDLGWGLSLGQIAERLLPEHVAESVLISVNGEVIQDRQVIPEAGCVVALRPLPQADLIIEAILYAVLATALNYIIQAIVGGPNQPDDIDRTPSATVKQIGNRFLPDAPVWRVLGKTRVSPPHAAVTLVRQRGTEPTTRALLFVTMGDAKISDIRFGETEQSLLPSQATSFRNVNDVDFPTIEQLYPGIKLEDRFGGVKTAYVQTFTNLGTQVELEFEFPGLARYSEKGNKRKHWVNLKIEYREVGSGSWIDFVNGALLETWGSAIVATAIQRGATNVVEVEGKTTSACGVRVSRDLGPVAKQWEARVSLDGSSRVYPEDYTKERGGSGDNVSTLFTDPSWVRFTSYLPGKAIKGFIPGCTVIDVTAIGETGNTQSASDINCIASATFPILSGSTRGAVAETSNPAAIALYYLTSHNGTKVTYEVRNPVPDAKIDFASFQEFYDYCEELVPSIDGGTEARHRCDGVLDEDGRSMWDVVSLILATGRATLDRIDGRYAIVIDRKQTAPRLILTDADVRDVRSTRIFPIRPHALRYTYRDRDLDHITWERVVYDDNYADDSGSFSGSLTYSIPSAGLALLTRSSGDFSADLSATQGFVRVEVNAIDRFFLIDSIVGTELVLHDPSGVLPASGVHSTILTATAAQRFERRVAPFTNRASEIWREGRYQLALQKLRSESYEVDCGIEWLGLQRGEMLEVSHEVFGWGHGRAVLIEYSPPGNAILEMRVDEEWDFAQVGDPAIRLSGYTAAGDFVTAEARVDEAATAALRIAKGSDQWFALQTPIDGSTWLRAGRNGASVIFGEYQLQTQELVVDAILKKRSEITSGQFNGKLLCRDHAPELFDAIDLEPIPNHATPTRPRSTVPTTGAPPGRPDILAQRVEFLTGAQTLTVASATTITRATGSFVTDGLAVGMRVRASGFANAANNFADGVITAVSALSVSLSGVSLVVEAGTGDEQLAAAIRTGIATISIDSLGTGLAQITVTAAGGGVVHVDGPASLGLFASFRASGFVYCGQGFRQENQGVFVVTGLHNGGDGITITNAIGVSETVGARFVRQSQLHRSSGSFLTDGLTAETYVSASGFSLSNTSTPFRIAAVSASDIFLDDPSGELRKEPGDGDEEVFETAPRIRADLTFPVGQAVAVGVTFYLAISAGASGSAPDRFEVSWRAYPRGSNPSQFDHVSLVSGQVTEVPIGPIDIDDDWDVQIRAVGADQQKSPPVSITRAGSVRLPARVTNLAAGPDASGGIVRPYAISWLPPTTAPLGSQYLIEVRTAGELQRVVRVNASPWSFDPSTNGTFVQFGKVYDVTVRLIDPYGRLGEPENITFTHTLTLNPINPFPNGIPNIGGLPGAGTSAALPSSLGSINFLGSAGIPIGVWQTPDFHIAFREPAMSVGTDLGAEPGGLGAGSDSPIDDAVKEFQVEIFDPDTSKILRTISQRLREVQYTPQMQYADQQRVFGRGLQKKLGARVKAILKNGQAVPMKSVVAQKTGDAGHDATLMRANAFANLSEAITASSTRVFDFNSAEADLWKTILQQSIVVEGSPNAANGRSVIAIGGFFQGVIDAGVYTSTGAQKEVYLHPQFQYRIVRNPERSNGGADGDEVFAIDPIHVSVGGAYFVPHISVVDLQPAGTYVYELQLRYTRSALYHEGLAQFGGLSGADRILTGTGTRWLRSGGFGQSALDPAVEIRIPTSAVNTNWNPIKIVNSDTQILFEADPIGSSEGTARAYEARIDNAENTDWPLGLTVSANSAFFVREDR